MLSSRIPKNVQRIRLGQPTGHQLGVDWLLGLYNGTTGRTTHDLFYFYEFSGKETCKVHSKCSLTLQFGVKFHLRVLLLKSAQCTRMSRTWESRAGQHASVPFAENSTHGGHCNYPVTHCNSICVEPPAVQRCQLRADVVSEVSLELKDHDHLGAGFYTPGLSKKFCKKSGENAGEPSAMEKNPWKNVS